MIINMTTQEFDKLGVRAKKMIFSEYLHGSKVNEIVFGSMTNGMWGEYKVRHETYAYSLIKVRPNEKGLAELLIYNYRTKQWQESPAK